MAKAGSPTLRSWPTKQAASPPRREQGYRGGSACGGANAFRRGELSTGRIRPERGRRCARSRRLATLSFPTATSTQPIRRHGVPLHYTSIRARLAPRCATETCEVFAAVTRGEGRSITGVGTGRVDVLVPGAGVGGADSATPHRGRPPEPKLLTRGTRPNRRPDGVRFAARPGMGVSPLNRRHDDWVPSPSCRNTMCSPRPARLVDDPQAMRALRSPAEAFGRIRRFLTRGSSPDCRGAPPRAILLARGSRAGIPRRPDDEAAIRDPESGSSTFPSAIPRRVKRGPRKPRKVSDEVLAVLLARRCRWNSSGATCRACGRRNFTSVEDAFRLATAGRFAGSAAGPIVPATSQTGRGAFGECGEATLRF